MWRTGPRDQLCPTRTRSGSRDPAPRGDCSSVVQVASVRTCATASQTKRRLCQRPRGCCCWVHRHEGRFKISPRTPLVSGKARMIDREWDMPHVAIGTDARPRYPHNSPHLTLPYSRSRVRCARRLSHQTKERLNLPLLGARLTVRGACGDTQAQRCCPSPAVTQASMCVKPRGHAPPHL